MLARFYSLTVSFHHVFVPYRKEGRGFLTDFFNIKNILSGEEGVAISFFTEGSVFLHVQPIKSVVLYVVVCFKYLIQKPLSVFSAF